MEVRKIFIREFFKTNKGGQAFLVQVSSDSILNNLLKINRLANQTIKWEKIKRQVGIQCFNCQLIGHVAKNCNRSYRCVKCDQNHGPKECKTETQDIENKNNLYCVN